MKRPPPLVAFTFLAVLGGMAVAGPALAYEYGLQFTPNPGGRNLVVAGYAFVGNTVSGNCSYSITTSGSGRGGGGSHTTYYDQTCGWDLYGNLLSVTPGAPTPPTPISTSGGLTIYARNAQGDVTGVDTAHGNVGFVNTPSAQYVWTTQGGGYVFLPNQTPVEIKLRIQSVGDLPLVIARIEPFARLAKASLTSTNCKKAPLSPLKTCVMTVTYDPSGLPPGDDPYTAYDQLTVGIVSNSGQATDFTESIEVPVAPGD